MDIKEKILQLRKFVPEGGANENESRSALEMAAKLMDKHGLTEEDLAEAQSGEGGLYSEAIECSTKIPSPGLTMHARMIEEFCEVKIWQTRGARSSIKVYGFEHDVKFAVFLLTMIDQTLTKEWKAYLKRKEDLNVDKHTRYWSFRAGFSSRVRQKIEALIKERNTKVSQGTDLVVIKSKILRDKIKEDFPDLSLSYKKDTTFYTSPEVKSKGSSSASSVNLTRPLAS